MSISCCLIQYVLQGKVIKIFLDEKFACYHNNSNFKLILMLFYLPVIVIVNVFPKSYSLYFTFIILVSLEQRCLNFLALGLKMSG